MIFRKCAIAPRHVRSSDEGGASKLGDSAPAEWWSEGEVYGAMPPLSTLKRTSSNDSIGSSSTQQGDSSSDGGDSDGNLESNEADVVRGADYAAPGYGSLLYSTADILCESFFLTI